ncbi:hypothetical protein BJ085DRAFT_40222 [Dimargaris cristalligena]|uniref:Uncharacterized protein n=1 Tax=Dimargaris cristalligena TaxID=215637 RepID=A0A4P9ZK65_9FUNG|nr:hypothetical protein BJ085DRAFT_40222 [Dimargaris cristalligena]|eukprot:RKP33428.1 hypothetical protein BJ085DRAFT_40222 [Dimargaris cristalligena]
MGPVSAAHQSERRLEVNGKRFVCDGIGGRNGAKECSWNGEDLATGQFVDEVNGKVFADDGGGHRRGLEDVAASVNLMVVDRGQVFQVQKAYFESGPTSSGKAAYSTSTIHVNLIFLPAIDPDPADDKRKKSEEEVRRSGMMITQSKRPSPDDVGPVGSEVG